MPFFHLSFPEVRIAYPESLIILSQRPSPRFHLHRLTPSTIALSACRHRGCCGAVDIRNHHLAALLELADQIPQSPDDLADNLVHLATHVQIEIRLNAEFFEHAATQILRVMLAGVAEDDAMSALAQFPVERNLLDDVVFRRDEDQVHRTTRVCAHILEESRSVVADLLHGKW